MRVPALAVDHLWRHVPRRLARGKASGRTALVSAEGDERDAAVQEKPVRLRPPEGRRWRSSTSYVASEVTTRTQAVTPNAVTDL